MIILCYGLYIPYLLASNYTEKLYISNYVFFALTVGDFVFNHLCLSHDFDIKTVSLCFYVISKASIWTILLDPILMPFTFQFHLIIFQLVFSFYDLNISLRYPLKISIMYHIVQVLHPCSVMGLSICVFFPSLDYYALLK